MTVYCTPLYELSSSGIFSVYQDATIYAVPLWYMHRNLVSTSVRATGLLCLLGVGIGLGSVVIYRLYTTLFPYRRGLLGSVLGSVTTHVKRPSSADIGQTVGSCDESVVETPDSGIAPDVLTALLKGKQFRKLRRSCSDCGIAARRATGWNQISELFDDEDEFTVVSLPVMRGCKRSAVVEDWLARTDVTRSDGCLRPPWSESQEDGLVYPQYDKCPSLGRSGRTTNGHPSCRSSGFMSAGLGGTGYTSTDLTDSEQGERGFFTSGGVMHRVGRMGYFTRPDGASGGSVDLSMAGSLIDAELRRRGLVGGSERMRIRRLSFSSEVSAGVASDYTYHDSLVSKGFSIDLGEDLAGMMTPPECSDGVRIAGLERWTESSMEKLHEELRLIQQDIDDMNERVGGLQSRDTIFYAIVPAGDFSPSASSPSDHHPDLIRFSPLLDFSMEKISVNSYDHHSGARLRRSRSSSAFSCADSDVGDVIIGAAGDFMWDYQSDLALELSDTPSFVAARPFIAEKFRHSEERSSCGDEIMYMEGMRERNGEQEANGEHCAAADLYIDDDLITLEMHNSDKMKVSPGDDDALVPGDDIMDWFDGEDVWYNASAARQQAKNSHQSDKSREKRDRERARKIRKNSVGSLRDVPTARGRQSSKSRGSSGASSCSHRKDTFAAAAMSRAGRKLPEVDRRNDAAASRNEASRPCSGRSVLDGSQYTPPLGSRPPTGVSTPVATVKPITEAVLTVSSALTTCCHGSVPTYNLVSEGMSRSSMGWVVENIGARVDVRDRVDRNTEVTQGYHQILRLWNKTHVRSIRADLYCCIRAVLFEAMLKQLPILSGAKTIDYCYQQLSKCMAGPHQYLNQWNFANRLPFAKESVQMKLAECLHALFEQVSAVSLMPSESCREEYLVALFNRNPDTDLRLLEAVKVLMMLRALSLYEDFTTGRSVASYVWQLFTRDSCRTIEQLFTNYINPIGDTTQLGQAEMCLLGHTLGLRIQIARPYCTDNELMLVSYPDEGADRYDTVQIIEENQTSGCYSVLTS